MKKERSQLLEIKQKFDQTLFGLLNNITNLMSSLHEKTNNQG